MRWLVIILGIADQECKLQKKLFEVPENSFESLPISISIFYIYIYIIYVCKVPETIVEHRATLSAILEAPTEG